MLTKDFSTITDPRKMFAKVTTIKVMVRREDQKQKTKFKPNRSDSVQ